MYADGLPISIDWCAIRHAIKVAFKYMVHGAILALSLYYFPAYGQLIDRSELIVVAVVSAVTMFIGNRILPDSLDI